MDPQFAAFWQTPLTYLKKVGPKRAEVLAQEAQLRTYLDLLHYLPYKYVDRRQVRLACELQPYETTTLIGTIQDYQVQRGKRRWLTATLRDETGLVELIWFQGIDYIQKRYLEGELVVVFGKAEPTRAGHFKILHPELEPLAEEQHAVLGAMQIVPFYSATEAMKRQGLDARSIRRLTHGLLEEAGQRFDEYLPPSLMAAHQLVPLAQAWRHVHFPPSWEARDVARARLKFEELFFFEMALAQRKSLLQPARHSPPFAQVGELFRRFYAEFLPFELTEAQKRVVREIRRDLGQATQMNRLVQGDVGSGKTMVAVLATLIAADNGWQTALLAPTEILAEQHFHSFYRLLSPLGVQVELLTGGRRKSERDKTLAAVASGHTHILIGTHALLEDAVQFRKLGLTIIDEQHKFGVLQRAKLWQKAPLRDNGTPLYPHNLVMTATPIPRTLAMTLYGDIDVSVIDELPPGRTPIRTVLRAEEQRPRVFGFIREQLEEGRQAYIVYPLVEETEKLDLLAVEKGYELIQRSFPERHIGIVHGKMKPDAKQYEMDRFKRGETHILVATTVIEVGVDVPNATVMVIENAERFGLSQLHQLRGRVGRGGGASFCILMAGVPLRKLGDTARKRLHAMCDTTDGFHIAEIDLELRGPGDFLGTRQSGLPEFQLADIIADAELLGQARQAAFDLIATDPRLDAPQHQALRREFRRRCAQWQLPDLVA
jgi:ATP-dependent DNA helicase RecG